MGTQLEDQATWFKWDKQKHLLGMIVSYADDLLFGGCAEAEQPLMDAGSELGFRGVQRDSLAWCGTTVHTQGRRDHHALHAGGSSRRPGGTPCIGRTSTLAEQRRYACHSGREGMLRTFTTKPTATRLFLEAKRERVLLSQWLGVELY